MAPQTKIHNSVLEAGASESEDDLATISVGAKEQHNNVSKMGGNKPQAMSRGTGAAATKRKAPAKAQSRQALKDRTNIQAGSETEEVDDFADDVKAKRAKVGAARNQTNSHAAPKARGRPPKRTAAATTLQVIPETQADPEDVSESIENDQAAALMDLSTVPTPPQVPRFAQRARSTSVQPIQPLLARPSARSVSLQPGYPPPRERSGSVSDTARERRGGDPEMRRKVNEMTKKYEDLSVKYQSLQEIGQSNAETNFEKLKRASDQKAKDASEVIASLRKELAELKKSSTSSSETALLEEKTKVSNLAKDNTALLLEKARLKEELQVSQNAVKSFEAKLVAARQQMSNITANQDSSRNASSATTRNDFNRNVGPSATDAQKEGKMKENLYADLTGLIIRSVKRNKDGEDEYDCLQTGRNGSKLHARDTYLSINAVVADIIPPSTALSHLHRE